MDDCQYTCLNVYIHVAYIHTHTYMCTYNVHPILHIYACKMYIYRHTYSHIFPHMSAYKHICIYTYTYIHIYMYSYIC